jgi:hypothetical protein
MTDETSRLLHMMEEDPDPEKKPDWLLQLANISEGAYVRGLQAYYALLGSKGFYPRVHPKPRHFQKYPIVAANTLLETLIHAENLGKDWEFSYCKEIVYDLVKIAGLPEFSAHINPDGSALPSHPIMRLLTGYLQYMEGFQPANHYSIKWGAYALVSCCPDAILLGSLKPSFGQSTLDSLRTSERDYHNDLGGKMRLYTRGDKNVKE